MTNTSISIRRALPVIPLAVMMSGCQAIEGIFKAGFWSGIIAVVVVLGIIGFVISRVRA